MLSFLLKHHKLIAVVFLLSVICGVLVLRNGIIIDNSLDTWFVQNDKVYQDYVDFRDRYSNNEVVAIYIKSGDVFTVNVISKMISLCKQIDSLPAVQRIFALHNAPYITSTIIGPSVVPLIGSVPDSQNQIEALKARVQKLPHYQSIFLDKAQQGFMIYAMLDKNAPDDAIDSITSITKSHFNSIHLGGIPVINQSLNKTANSESKRLSALSVLAVIVLLVFFLRSWRYVIIAVLSVSIPVVWIVAGYTLWGGSFNMVTIVIPTLLLITGTATSIHIINICHRFYIQTVGNVESTLRNALQYVFWPCFFTATTTMAGFVSLAISPIDGIKQAGILAAIGVGLVFISSFVVTAVAFMVFPPKIDANINSNIQLSSQTKFILSQFDRLNKRVPRLALWLFTAIIAISIMLISQIEVKSHALDYLTTDSPAYIDNAIIEREVGPFLPVEMLVISDSTFTAEQLHKLNRFQDNVARTGKLHNVFSPVDLISYLNTAIFLNYEYKLPVGLGTTEWLKNIYLKNRKENYQKYDNSEFTEIRISATTFIGSSKDYQTLTDSINSCFSKVFSDANDPKLSIRGYMPMYVAMNTHIVQGQIKTFALAFVLILVLIVICFKSFKLALLALLPNIFPISMVIITMFISGIPMDQSTALITCVILGIAFDDSIHLIYAFRNLKQKGESNSEATKKALQTTASAMIATSIALFAGFAIIATLSSAGLMYYGFLCSIAVIASLLGNIWLFPLLLKSDKKSM